MLKLQLCPLPPADVGHVTDSLNQFPICDMEVTYCLPHGNEYRERDDGHKALA